MKNLIMKIISRCILKAPLSLVLLCAILVSCKSSQPLIDEVTDVEVNERFVPVVTDRVSVAAFAKVEIKDGVPYIPRFSVIDNVQSDVRPKVDLHIDKDGILQLHIEISPDTLNVAVADTTKHTKTTVTKEVEKDLNALQKALILVGILAVVYIVSIFVRRK